MAARTIGPLRLPLTAAGGFWWPGEPARMGRAISRLLDTAATGFWTRRSAPAGLWSPILAHRIRPTACWSMGRRLSPPASRRGILLWRDIRRPVYSMEALERAGKSRSILAHRRTRDGRLHDSAANITWPECRTRTLRWRR